MPKTVAVAGVGNVDFPDDMSEDDIVSAIETDILPRQRQITAKVAKSVAPVATGKVATPTLDREEITGRDVKRRAAAGVPIALSFKHSNAEPSVIDEFGSEIKKSLDTAATSAIAGIKKSAIPSALAGFENMSPKEIQRAAKFGPLQPLVAMRSKGYREGAANVRDVAEEAMRADLRHDQESPIAETVGEFGGAIAGDAPLYALQPELGAAIPARIAARYGAGVLPKVAGYLLKQGVNVPVDVLVGAADQLIKSGQLPSKKELATQAGMALLARNLLGLLHTKGPEPEAAARNVGPKVVEQDASAISESRATDRRVAEEPVTSGERRVAIRRAKVAEETGLPEDHPAIDRIIKHDESEVVKGVPNRRVWEAEIRDTTKNVASVDIDNLKPVNDSYGHLAGDSLIAANGEALRIAADENGALLAHISGDELRLAHDDPAVLTRVVERADGILRERGVFYVDAAGNRIQLPPEAVKGFSHGIGPNEAAAEVALKSSKAERTAAGFRTERPSGDVARSGDSGGASEAGREVRTRSSEEVGSQPPQVPPPPGEVPPSGAAPPPIDLPRYARPSSINLERLNISDDAKSALLRTAEDMRPELEKLRGRPLTHEEIIEDAAGAHLLRRAIPRAESARNIAQQLRTRQHLAGMLEGRQPVTAEMVERIKQVSAFATDAGRRLNAQKIGADPILETAQAKMIQRLTDLGKKTDDIVKAAEGVDFDDARQAAKFYRQFVKPSLREILDEYRYANMLSSPRTHIVNAFSNLLQVGVLRPQVKLWSGAFDWLASSVTGAERQHFISEVPAYYRGAANSFGTASKEALKALTGKSAITNLDLNRIPTGSRLTAPFRAVSNFLEAGDVFFRTMAEGGELEALAVKHAQSGQELTDVALAQMRKTAKENAAETIFRKPLDPTNESGHGYVLARIDKITGAVEQALKATPGGRWVVPFIRTPTNILKQGIEFSPFGLATLPGSTRTTEQLAKTFIGSTVFAGAAGLAMEGRTTWSVPKGEKERAAFYAAGLQPYSVKIGDNWFSFSKLGPLSYPIAMAAAAKHYATDAPEMGGAGSSEKMGMILLGIAEFFSDQSYVQGLATLLEVPKGVSDAGGAVIKTASNFATQLVPMSALLRWVDQIIDPVYRKTNRKFSSQAIIDNLKKGIPGLSQTLPAYKTPSGAASERSLPLLNAFSPVSISEEAPNEKKRFDRLQAARRRVAAQRRANAE